MTDSPSPPSPGEDSWTARLSGAWKEAAARVARQAFQWFRVDDAQVAEILAAVREKLPATEVLLVGKPQAGKSSIVRGLTGVSAEIVGQGFRPHTQHTQSYAYPSSDLPLFRFTDTVGLGDVSQDARAIVEELMETLQGENRRARVLILTVKIGDFATDTLKQIATQLRRRHPDIPCLLAVTSLHEVYPPDAADHPPYPPDFEAVQRTLAAMEQTFAGLYDRIACIDFTLEGDGYTPVFYGLEALRDALAELLPEAEARTIYQLLDEGASQQIGHLYREVGRRYILAFSTLAAALAAVPLPFAAMPVLTALQVSMVGVLGKLYGQVLSPSQVGGIASTLAAGFLAQAVGRELIKFLPGIGSAISASWAAAYTWALGEGACLYFGDLVGGKKPDPKRIQSAMEEAFQNARERFDVR